MSIIEPYITKHGRRIMTEVINAPARKRKPFRADFVKLPMSWIDALRGASGGACQLAHKI